MSIIQFLQALVNNRMFSVTTKEMTTLSKQPRSKVFNTLKKLQKDGVVRLFKAGKHSYWDIWLSYDGPYVPYDDKLNHCVEPDLFGVRTMKAMEHNHVNLTALPVDMMRTTVKEEQELDLLNQGFTVLR